MTDTVHMTRWKAGAIHLLVSVILIGLIATYVWLRWTPDGLWAVAVVDRSLLILFTAVLLIVPALTTLVYRTNKRALRSDLIVVAVLQLAFLAYGTWMLARTRPVFLVAAVDRFEVIFANDIDPADLAAAQVQYQQLSWTGPQLVGLQRAPSLAAQGPALVSDTTQQPAYYVDFEAYSPILLSRAQPLDPLIAQSNQHRNLIVRALQGLGRDQADTRFVPVTSRRRGSMVMLVDAESALPLQTLPLDPWL